MVKKMTKEKALDNKLKKLENIKKFTNEEVMYLVTHFDEVVDKCEYIKSILTEFPRNNKYKEIVENRNRIEREDEIIEERNKVM